MTSIFGITFDETKLGCSSFDNDFTVVRDLDEESYYDSNKVFHHEEDDLSFDYRYVIAIRYYEDDNGKCWLENSLYLTPTFNSLCDTAKLEIASLWGANSIEELDDERFSDISCGEIAEEGFGVCVGSSCYEAPNGWRDLDKAELDRIASVVGYIDSFRGFYIDKPWNKIGTTGWDTLKHDIKGEPLFKF